MRILLLIPVLDPDWRAIWSPAVRVASNLSMEGAEVLWPFSIGPKLASDLAERIDLGRCPGGIEKYFLFRTSQGEFERSPKAGDGLR